MENYFWKWGTFQIAGKLVIADPHISLLKPDRSWPFHVVIHDDNLNPIRT